MSKNSFGDDKYDLQGRVEKVIDSLLTEFEQQPLHFDIRSKLAIVQYVSSYLARRARVDDGDEPEAGSAVKRYAGAFQTAHIGPRRSRRGITKVFDADDDQ